MDFLNRNYSFIYLFIASVYGDIYLHNPRGSNNRLNEKSAARTNANRAFDSQNNNRGGYNVGDALSVPAGEDENKQYQMKHFYSSQDGKSLLTLEWTNQHGCGRNYDPHKQNCNILLQYTCQSQSTGEDGLDDVRDGVNTQQQPYSPPASNDESEGDVLARRSSNLKNDRVLHESWYWYDKCYRRENNKNLFRADQVLNKNKLGYSSSAHTRQNPQATRRGLECPEERDHYPYWHPTPWTDIAILTDQTDMCSYYERESFNSHPRYECVEFYDGDDVVGRRRHWSRYNNEEDCERNGGKWQEFYSYLERATGYASETACIAAANSRTTNNLRYVWGVRYDSDTLDYECLLSPQPVECLEAPWTRSNHLGNTRDGEASRYTWTLPHFPSQDTYKCVVRIRYNISTDDYDGWRINSSFNEDKSKGKLSPIQQNPIVNVGMQSTPLKLAINTAQFGRTFQDRSHVFILMPRPPAVPTSALIYNLNVRGKRGNIVQVYPAVEYDFIPNKLDIKEGDLLHIQWTGSNTHNNGNPGGDGQTGDAGEGEGGTDRHNMVEIVHPSHNYPLPYSNTSLWRNSEVVWEGMGDEDIMSSQKHLALSLATSNYYTSGDYSNVLNTSPASYPGVLLRISRGVYHYMSTRNNNFSNRSQKGRIIVK